MLTPFEGDDNPPTGPPPQLYPPTPNLSRLTSASTTESALAQLLLQLPDLFPTPLSAVDAFPLPAEMMRGVSEGGSDGGAWRGDDDDTKQMDEEEWVVKGDTNDRGEDAGEEEDETAVNEPVVKKRRPRQKPRSRKEPEHRTHFCPHCPMAFYRAEHLGRHLRIHSGEKPYKCDFCGRCFGRSDEVARHSKVHTKRKKPKSGVRRPRKKKNCFVTTDTDVNAVSPSPARTVKAELRDEAPPQRRRGRKRKQRAEVQEPPVNECPAYMDEGTLETADDSLPVPPVVPSSDKRRKDSGYAGGWPDNQRDLGAAYAFASSSSSSLPISVACAGMLTEEEEVDGEAVYRPDGMPVTDPPATHTDTMGFAAMYADHVVGYASNSHNDIDVGMEQVTEHVRQHQPFAYPPYTAPAGVISTHDGSIAVLGHALSSSDHESGDMLSTQLHHQSDVHAHYNGCYLDNNGPFLMTYDPHAHPPHDEQLMLLQNREQLQHPDLHQVASHCGGAYSMNGYHHPHIVAHLDVNAVEEVEGEYVYGATPPAEVSGFAFGVDGGEVVVGPGMDARWVVL